MNRPTIIHTAYPGLLELDHSHSLQVLHINGTLAPIKTGILYVHLLCVQYLMNGTIDLHWNNKISIADGL